MKVLLDTHALLWLVSNDPRLSPVAKDIFLADDSELFLSAVSGFEISVKYALGKLELPSPPREFIIQRMREESLTALPIRMEHTYRLAHLPNHHRDPFDRLLITQAQEEDLPVLTADPAFAMYEVPTLW